MTDTKQRTAEMSASFYRQLFFIRLCEIELKWFEAQIRTESLFKAISRLMRNQIASHKLFNEQIDKLMPKSKEQIENAVDENKLLVISSILEKLSYMTIEQLEHVDGEIRFEEDKNTQDEKTH